MASQRLDEQIEEVRRGRSTTLDLRRLGLREIPEEVFGLVQLKELFLRANHITRVPGRIRELPNLQVLDLTRNPIQELPDIPGLSLDWNTYLRCCQSVSAENVHGILVDPTEASEPARLLTGITALPGLRYLRVGADYVQVQTASGWPTPGVG